MHAFEKYKSMNFKKSCFAFFLFTAIIFIGCKNKTEPAKDENNRHGLELNEAKKWEVVGNMLSHIRLMSKNVSDFQSDEDRNYALLAENLHTNVDSLISNCTMTGKAHKELHKWLMPHIQFIDDLAAAPNDVKAKAAIKSIQNSLKNFNQYFE